MAKDSYWFRHDCSAGRGTRLRKLQHIHGHWGKGVYWDVIELLREQENYQYESDDSSLQMLADLIGCKDESKFITWFRDCIKLNLFLQDGGFFYSEILNEHMQTWETKKNNRTGKKKKEQITDQQRINNGSLTKQQDNITEQYITIQNRIEDKNTRAKKSFAAPTVEQVIEYFELKGYSKEAAVKAFEYYSEANWHDSGGKPVKNWKQKMISVWFKPENETKKIKEKTLAQKIVI